MATKLIGIKEFRKNISGFARKAQNGESRYIIMNRNTPIFELKPFGKNTDLESVFMNIFKKNQNINKKEKYPNSNKRRKIV